MSNKTLNSKATSEKIQVLARDLARMQGSVKLFVVPFEELQKEIIKFTPADCRMIVYRRFMMRILNVIGSQVSAKGIVTGDSLGQVASQTIENLTIIWDSCSVPVLAPLLGKNKNEIIAFARRIGTFDHSILPYEDCCSFMIAKNPKTKARLFSIEGFEKKIDLSLVQKAVEAAQVVSVTFRRTG